jgi:uncharacterized Zn finger protein (UPF0148 family)
MNNEKYSRKVTLHCPTCGNSDFEYDPNTTGSIRCPSCEREFSKDDLIRENREIIENNIDEIKREIVKDIKKEFQNIFKKSR